MHATKIFFDLHRLTPISRVCNYFYENHSPYWPPVQVDNVVVILFNSDAVCFLHPDKHWKMFSDSKRFYSEELQRQSGPVREYIEEEEEKRNVGKPERSDQCD